MLLKPIIVYYIKPTKKPDTRYTYAFIRWNIYAAIRTMIY